MASGPAPPVVSLLVLPLVLPLVPLGVEVVLSVVCELLNPASELVGGGCDDIQSAAGVDGGGGGPSVDAVERAEGAWPGGGDVMAGTSAALVDVSFVQVCPCARVMDGLETRGKVEFYILPRNSVVPTASLEAYKYNNT